MTEEEEQPPEALELVPFHPIDTRYTAAIDVGELRRAYAVGLVVQMADHIAIPVDRIGGLCGEIDAFLRGDGPKLRAVK